MKISTSDKIEKFTKENQNLTLVTKKIAAIIIAGTLGISTAAATREVIEGEYDFQESGYTYILKNKNERQLQERNRKYYKENKKRIDAYNNITSSCANLLLDAPLSNPNEYMGAFCYLLYTGYFSENNYYEYNSDILETEPHLIEFMGMQITSSRGVCRNEASMLSDILSKMGIKSYTIGAKMYEDKEYIYPNGDAASFIQLPRIKGGKFEQQERIASEDPSIEHIYDSNHCVTLIMYNGELSVLDPTNAYIFDVQKEGDKYSANIISGVGQIDLNLAASISVRSVTLKELKEINNYLQNPKTITEATVWNDFTNGVAWCLKNPEKIEAFRETIESQIEICNEPFGEIDNRTTPEQIAERKELLDVALEKYSENVEYKEKESELPTTKTSALPFAAIAVLAIASNLRDKRNDSGQDKRTK